MASPAPGGRDDWLPDPNHRIADPDGAVHCVPALDSVVRIPSHDAGHAYHITVFGIRGDGVNSDFDVPNNGDLFCPDIRGYVRSLHGCHRSNSYNRVQSHSRRLRQPMSPEDKRLHNKTNARRNQSTRMEHIIILIGSALSLFYSSTLSRLTQRVHLVG